jgi:hypothetical protein
MNVFRSKMGKKIESSFIASTTPSAPSSAGGAQDGELMPFSTAVVEELADMGSRGEELVKCCISCARAMGREGALDVLTAALSIASRALGPRLFECDVPEGFAEVLEDTAHKLSVSLQELAPEFVAVAADGSSAEFVRHVARLEESKVLSLLEAGSWHGALVRAGLARSTSGGPSGTQLAFAGAPSSSRRLSGAAGAAVLAPLASVVDSWHQAGKLGCGLFGFYGGPDDSARLGSFTRTELTERRDLSGLTEWFRHVASIPDARDWTGTPRDAIKAVLRQVGESEQTHVATALVEALKTPTGHVGYDEDEDDGVGRGRREKRPREEEREAAPHGAKRTKSSLDELLDSANAHFERDEDADSEGNLDGFVVGDDDVSYLSSDDEVLSPRNDKKEPSKKKKKKKSSKEKKESRKAKRLKRASKV